MALLDLLRNPNPDDALQPSIGQEYQTNPAQFEKKVKEFLKKYAS
jgi:ubiquitin-protein ligase